MINYYEVLEVSQKASEEIIEKAYKVLAKKYHPDLQQGKDKKIAEEKMKIINEAYEILSSKEKRDEYDKKLYNEREQNSRNVQEQQKAKQNSAYEKENVNYTQEQRNVNNYYQEQMRIQREYQERLEKEARIRYAKAYENYLRSLGYKIKYKWTWERVKALLLTIIFIIVISAILWWIPYSREFLIKLYQENFAIKLIVDLISNVIEVIISIFKK